MEHLNGKVMRLYKIDDHPDYQSLNTINDIHDKLLFKMNGMISIKKEWEELGTCYIKFLDTKLKAIKDYAQFTNTRPIFSPRAVEVLKDFFIDGELLEIKSIKENKTFYIYNIFPKIDCIDYKNSELIYYDDKINFRLDSPKIIFLKEKINKNIFRERSIFTYVLVTDKFVSRVIDNKLEGFKFISQWDSELGDIKEKEIIYIPPKNQN